MKLALSTVVLLALAPACSKQKTANHPTNASAHGSSDRTGAKATKVATGDMRSMLVHLRRVHFAYDSSTLQQQSRDELQAAAALLEKHPGVSLYIDGHADQRGTTEYNLGLGDRRSRTVIDFLTRLGIGSDRLQPVSFGSERPLRDGGDDVSNATNRRVEFRLMRGDIQLVLDDGLRFDDRGTPIAKR